MKGRNPADRHRNSFWWQPLNLDRLQRWAADGRLPTDRVVTMKDLRDSGAVHKNLHHGVKLLATVSALPLMPKHPDDLSHQAGGP
jgi:Ribosomal proteins 50S-L15, 50S-L18e, 60S-L27A